MLVSKLDIKKYPWGNAKKWLKFKNPLQNNIDPVFASRLAALGSDLKLVIQIIRGSATHAEQKAIGDLKMKQNPGWTRKATGAIYNEKGQCMVAAPGTSPHEQLLAIDGDARIEALSPQVLAKYGLVRPMAYELWHIQPIETKGLTFAAREKFFKPIDIPVTIEDFQRVHKLTVDGVYGPMTHELAQKLLKV